MQSLCVEDNHQLVGNTEVPSVKPVIITYENPLSVFPKYVELLSSTLIPAMDNLSVLEIANRERLKDPLHRVNVKACGWVGRKNVNGQNRFIESYFPAFERKNARTRAESNSFNDFILKNPSKTVKDYATSIIQGILNFLDLCDVKNDNRRYTRTSLLGFFAVNNPIEKENFLNKIMNWALSVVNSNHDDISEIKNAIYQYITTTILPLFGKEVTSEANEFFYAVNENVQEDEISEQGNIYHAHDIDIEVATVHSVKGETHISTLYLETSYFGQHESERLAEQFKGLAYTGHDEKIFRSLKVAYVGMSRPRYLLCVAIQKDRFDNMDSPELRDIWNVVEG